MADESITITFTVKVVRAGVKPQPILHIRLEVVDGRIQVDRFGLASQEAGRPITAADLRYWDFDTVVRLVEQRVGEIASMRARAVADGVNTIEDLQAAVADGVAAADTHRTYRSIDADLLERVAEIVTANRQKPALAVRTEMSTTSRNASRWIAAARKQGFLPPLPKEQLMASKRETSELSGSCRPESGRPGTATRPE